MSKKRIGIFQIHDSEGIIGKYIDYLLNDIINLIDDLYIVVNGNIKVYSRLILEKYTKNIILRENEGFDATAWKNAIIKYIGYNKIKLYDELILFNDSFYGPIYPFKKVFDEMDKLVNIDFWGITCSYSFQDYNFGSEEDNYIVPDHLQSYFLVIRNKMINSYNFIKFWKTLPKINNLIDDIKFFETRFTQYFSKCGFKWDTFVKYKNLKSENFNNFNYYMVIPYQLVIKYKMPIVKRKSLTQTQLNSTFGAEKEAKRLINYIDKETNYDISLIWEDLLRKNNIADLYTKLHLDYILSTKDIIYKNNNNYKIALLIHITYKDQVEYCFNYISNMPKNSDIYITTLSECEEIIREKFLNFKKNKLEIRILKNRGRDIAALYIGCADIINNDQYDLICCIHDKKSKQVGIIYGMNFRDVTFDNSLASSEFIDNIIGLFEKEKFLGCLGVPNILGEPYWFLINNSWALNENYNNTVDLLKKCKIKVPLSYDKPPIFYGHVFWVRPTILKPLLDLNLKYEDFDKEPIAPDGRINHAIERTTSYLAQFKGYYSGVLYSDEYASIYLTAFKIRASISNNEYINKYKGDINEYKSFIRPYTSKLSLAFIKHLYNLPIKVIIHKSFLIILLNLKISKNLVFNFLKELINDKIKQNSIISLVFILQVLILILLIYFLFNNF
jgi:rhamnosyltransferase